jgi:outer membrane protein assembly complex protein YaeT
MGTKRCEFIPFYVPLCELIVPGTVQRQRLDEDVDRIVQLYNDHGYLQARVESSDIQVDKIKARATIRIVVVEGPQFRVGGVDITGTNVLPVEEIRRQILFKPGDVFSRSQLRDSVKKITDVYGTIGRASADVNPVMLQDLPNLKMNVTFEITEGPEVFVERINVAGNTRSEEKILRREIPMAEGDLFTTQKLARARQKLVNLNYFETVNTTTAPGASKDRIIVNIDVTEKPTGVFSIGGVPPARRRRQHPERNDQLHRAVVVRPAAGGRLRSLQPPTRVHGLHHQLARHGHPFRPPDRRLLPVDGALSREPGHDLGRRPER